MSRNETLEHEVLYSTDNKQAFEISVTPVALLLDQLR